jgi:hypothetical protein
MSEKTIQGTLVTALDYLYEGDPRPGELTVADETDDRIKLLIRPKNRHSWVGIVVDRDEITDALESSS